MARPNDGGGNPNAGEPPERARPPEDAPAPVEELAPLQRPVTDETMPRATSPAVSPRPVAEDGQPGGRGGPPRAIGGGLQEQVRADGTRIVSPVNPGVAQRGEPSTRPGRVAGESPRPPRPVLTGPRVPAEVEDFPLALTVLLADESRDFRGLQNIQISSGRNGDVVFRIAGADGTPHVTVTKAQIDARRSSP